MTDICLILEGTFPYVAGGVSSWVSDLVSNLDDLTFSIIYLGAHRPGTKKMQYDIPSNVLDFQEYYIFDYLIKKEKGGMATKENFHLLAEFLKNSKQGDPSLFENLANIIGPEKSQTISSYDLIHSYNGWKMLMDVYQNEKKEPSFIDFFWSWRFIYLPFFTLLRIPLSPARVYHTVSTGYAGLLGSLCKIKYNRPLLLTEHGIYTRERKIEIAQADWIYSETAEEIKITEEKEFFKEWWLSLFSFFSRVTYEKADEIITLYEGNRQIQIEEGADFNKTSIIPNGIDFKTLSSMPREPFDGTFRIGFMGRIVPIKDIKTFIRACKMIYEEISNIEFYIMGPTDEDEEYYKECLQLAEEENLTDILRFTGKIKVKKYYPKIDIIVLTSISEAQPLVILEAHACGIPCVSTDVGCCRELFYGRTPDDRLLGQSGIITSIYSPKETAEAVIKILKNTLLYSNMSKVSKLRIEKYYQQDDVWANYDQLYNHYMEEIRWQA